MVTGTTKSGALSQEVVKALEFEQLTLVILMGFQKLGQLAALYRSKGKGDLPVAVVQNGSLKDEKIALGTMETIEQQVAEAGLTTPAVIIIGKVVELHTAYQTLRNEYTVFSN